MAGSPRSDSLANHTFLTVLTFLASLTFNCNRNGGGPGRTHTYVALSDGWKCSVCRTFTSRALLESWLSTPCPGEVQTYKGIRSGRRLVHYTHNLRQTRGVLWCKSCGFFAVHRCDFLAEKCKCIGLIRMPTPAGQAFLQRIKRGIPPVGYAVWPDENTIGDMRPAFDVWGPGPFCPSALPCGRVPTGFYGCCLAYWGVSAPPLEHRALSCDSACKTVKNGDG